MRHTQVESVSFSRESRRIKTWPTVELWGVKETGTYGYVRCLLTGQSPRLSDYKSLGSSAPLTPTPFPNPPDHLASLPFSLWFLCNSALWATHRWFFPLGSWLAHSWLLCNSPLASVFPSSLALLLCFSLHGPVWSPGPIQTGPFLISGCSLPHLK